MGRRHTPEMFWTKVNILGPDECWEWTKYRSKQGYGNTSYKAQFYMSHRLAWELTNGPIPNGRLVCHSCDNPPCCNPGHLWLGDYISNAQDMVNKDRQHKGDAVPYSARKRGSKNKTAKLTEADIPAIRAALANGERLATIAARYGVSNGPIVQIQKGKYWRHVPGGPETPPEPRRVGSRHVLSKLTEADIPHIRAALARGETSISIATRYGVTYGLISHIKHGRNWTHVP